jgi:DNA-binding response OmpR family regulator
MPRLDGYQVCRALQQHPETSHIPILLLSVKGQLDDPDLDDTTREARLQERMEGFEAGASDFLSKPVKAKELEERIKMLLWFSGI